jgi:hypothetical protein
LIPNKVVGLCPKDKPYFNISANECGVCPEKTKLNPNDNTVCVKCPAEQFYNASSNKCEFCPKNTFVDVDDFFRCLRCPQSIPFYNKTSLSC